MKPDFPAVIDSSLMASWRSCPRKGFLEYFEHWKPHDPSVHLHAGAAFAAGLETAREEFYVKKNSPELSVQAGLARLLKEYGDFECPPESAKSLERMLGALEFYFYSYPLGQDKAIPVTLPTGKRGIEFSFLEPLEIAHPVSGDPLLYAGRLDMLCSYGNLTLGEDDKTTSSLGASWPKQWDLRSQFTSYVWGAQRSGLKLDGFLIRGISILKTKYDTMEAITYRPEWQLERWYAQLHRDLTRMIAQWKEGYFDFNLDHGCTEYGGCVFRSVCLMKDPSQLLAQQFQQRRWDPVTRMETVL